MRAIVDPEDVVQRVCVTAWRRSPLASIPNERAFTRWLMTAVHHEIQATARSLRAVRHPRTRTSIALERIQCVGEGALLASMASTPEGGELPAELDLPGFEDLSWSHRLVVVLREGLDVSWETTAFVLERSTERAARMLHCRARRALAKRWDRPPEGQPKCPESLS